MFNVLVRYLLFSCWDRGVIFLSCWVNWIVVAFRTSGWFCVCANFTFLSLKSLWGSLLSYLLKTRGGIGIVSGSQWLCCACTKTLALMHEKKVWYWKLILQMFLSGYVVMMHPKTKCLQFCMDVWDSFLTEEFREEDDVVILKPEKKSRGKEVIFELVPWEGLVLH